jgi:hypothetical protein
MNPKEANMTGAQNVAEKLLGTDRRILLVGYPDAQIEFAACIQIKPIGKTMWSEYVGVNNPLVFDGVAWTSLYTGIGGLKAQEATMGAKFCTRHKMPSVVLPQTGYSLSHILRIYPAGLGVTMKIVCESQTTQTPPAEVPEILRAINPQRLLIAAEVTRTSREPSKQQKFALLGIIFNEPAHYVHARVRVAPKPTAESIGGELLAATNNASIAEAAVLVFNSSYAQRFKQ